MKVLFLRLFGIKPNIFLDDRQCCQKTFNFRQVFQSPEPSPGIFKLLGWRQNKNLSVELDKTKKRAKLKHQDELILAQDQAKQEKLGKWQ